MVKIKTSSKRWLQRQSKDLYVKGAKDKGYRSRAAFKLLEIDKKHNILRKPICAVDLGAAPGSWSQVLAEHCAHPKSQLIALDKLPMDPIDGVTCIQKDFTELDENYDNLFPEKIDLILTDMAPSTTGHRGTDHLQSLSLAEKAAHFSRSYLTEGGSFITKVFQGGELPEFVKFLRSLFRKVSYMKPQSSRKESVEVFIVCQHFKAP